MKSAVLFIIFKRPDTTRRVFDRIREAQPPRLYIAADGPRKDHVGESEKCQAARKVVEYIDWPCEVYRLYRDENLGCGVGPFTAITWFFEHEEQGIIIEDDILPHIDFFKYCDEMLDRYKDDESIQLIAGRNSFYDDFQHEYSYYKSSLFHIWGWASWRRVWNTYQYNTSEISFVFFKKKLNSRSLLKKTNQYWMRIFERMQRQPIETWDFQLYFNEIINDRYSIIPFVNMVENIGFDKEATHTHKGKIKETTQKGNSPYPIKHPECISENHYADAVFALNFGFFRKSFCSRVISKFRSVLQMIQGQSPV